MNNGKLFSVNSGEPVIAWWSGGVTSAVTCKLCIDWFGVENVRVIFIDTKNEYDDTYTFKTQCENWYGKKIETISSTVYANIKSVWYHFLSLNTATGAICSTHLKLLVREKFQSENKYWQLYTYSTQLIVKIIGKRFNKINLVTCLDY